MTKLLDKCQLLVCFFLWQFIKQTSR